MSLPPSKPDVRQLPVLLPENRPFWTGGKDGRLLIARCGACSVYLHPPLPRCPNCASARVAPESVSGRGRIASFTVNHEPWLPGLAVPYVIAAIELAEQARLHVISNLTGCEIAAVHIGMPVEVLFEQHEDVWLPLFRPSEEVP